MATDPSKVSARLSTLNNSLDELEATLEPLFSQTLPESVVGLEKIQQAKLQVALPYVLYDLVFIYLKTRGIDPKAHPVIAELDRVRQYFDKIKDAEDPAKRRLAVDKGVANRFIKHAIAQVQFGRPPGQDEGASQNTGVRVPVKVTSKMTARAQHQQELKELGSEEEDDLEVFDDEKSTSESSTPNAGKGKARAVEIDDEVCAGQKRRRPIVDPFAGYGDEESSQGRMSKIPKSSSNSRENSNTPGDIAMADVTGSSTPQSASESTAKAKKQAAKNARKKAKRRESANPPS